MNELARLVSQLAKGNKEDQINLSETARNALDNLRLLLDRGPQNLAVWLAHGHMPLEEWLSPPPAITNQSHP